MAGISHVVHMDMCFCCFSAEPTMSQHQLWTASWMLYRSKQYHNQFLVLTDKIEMMKLGMLDSWLENWHDGMMMVGQ